MCAANNKSRSGGYLEKQNLQRKKKNVAGEKEDKRIIEVDDKLLGDDRDLEKAEQMPKEKDEQKNNKENY